MMKIYKKVMPTLSAVVGILLFVSCTNEDDINASKTNMDIFSGKDITTYASLSADLGTKTTTLKINQSGSWKLYQTGRDSNFDFNTPLLSGSTMGTIELSNTFHIYCLEWTDGSRAGLGLRQLPIEGQPNFRDLGGYRTKDGRRVKYGMIFRSGKCHAITDNDLNYLSSIPLKTIIDFRSQSEKEKEEDRIPTSVQTVKWLPIDPGNLSGEKLFDAIQRGDTLLTKGFMIDLNKALVRESQQQYKDFFAMVMDQNNTPLMFHCTAGKDRAGFAAALILLSLGVDRETVIEDYLLSNIYTNTTLENTKKQYGDNNAAIAIYTLLSVQTEYINTAFATIEEEYGSIDNFLTQQLGVDVTKMKEMYLY